MSIATEILDQLAEQYAQAEQHAQARPGDTVIYRLDNGATPIAYKITEQDMEDTLAPGYRILERAKPKRPEWEAVVASNIMNPGHPREVYVRIPGRVNDWESPTRYANCDDLVDPVPLVEMPERDVLWRTIRRASGAIGVAEAEAVTDAVLELLKGERKA